jgi:hypothetical protein
MTDVGIQTDDILINGIPLHEFLDSIPTNDNSLWAFIDKNEKNSDGDGDDMDDDMDDDTDKLDNVIRYSAPDIPTVLSDTELECLQESIFYCIDEIVKTNAQSFSDPLFHTKLENALYDIIDSTFCESSSINDVFVFSEDMEEQFEYVIHNCLKEYFDKILPPRSYPDTSILRLPNIEENNKKIKYLQSIPQEEQRTPGWYKFRYNLITASAAWKVFKSDSCVNQLIYEKCKPLVSDSGSGSGSGSGATLGCNLDDIDDVEKEQQVIVEKTYVNTNSPLHWGQKYEKLSVMIYEAKNNTIIGEFGCIKHPKYDFLGASPDGINIDPLSPLYGRMLEIKNIVNREITGTPIEEYWIQTQLQMHVCDCDECDFLETCFKEYDDEAAFLHDSASDIDCEFHLTSAKTLKGVIAYFMKDGKPLYEYAPLYLTRIEYDKWCEEIIDKNTGITWLKNIYWYLERYSCVLIRKNDIWFEHAIPKIENVWNTILKERENGYEHRAPKKRAPRKKNNISEGENVVDSGCLVLISDLELNI